MSLAKLSGAAGSQHTAGTSHQEGYDNNITFASRSSGEVSFDLTFSSFSAIIDRCMLSS